MEADSVFVLFSLNDLFSNGKLIRIVSVSKFKTERIYFTRISQEASVRGNKPE